MITKYYVDANGIYLGGFAGDTGVVPDGAIQVQAPPASGLDTWNGSAWIPNTVVILAAKKMQLRTVREGILNRLSGIALAAQLTGDTATTGAYIAVRQGLLDITEDLPADATVDGIVIARYAALVDACTPQMVAAFAKFDT